MTPARRSARHRAKLKAELRRKYWSSRNAGDSWKPRLAAATERAAQALGSKLYGVIYPPRPTPRCAAALQDGRSRCLQASDPDETGRYNAGLGIEHLQAAIGRARLVIAQVNPELSWTLRRHGDRAGGDRCAGGRLSRCKARGGVLAQAVRVEA